MAETGMGAFQQYQDAAYKQAQRNIAPQQEAQSKQFEQQMLNKGITPGSKAFNLAQAQMQRGQNDQNNSANFQAMQFGQQAQAQEFGQNFQNKQLGENKRQFDVGMGQRESEFGRSLGEQGRQFDVGQGNQMDQFGRTLSNRQAEFGSTMGFQNRQLDSQNRQFDVGQANEMDKFGRGLFEQGRQFDTGQGNEMDRFSRSLMEQGRQYDLGFGEQGRQFDVGMGQRESEFGRNFANMESQQDFQNLLGLGDFGMRLGDFSTRNAMQDYNMRQTMLGMAPNQQAQQLNVQGAYQDAMTGANNVYTGRQNAYNSMIGGVTSLAGAALMPSALEYKRVYGKTKQDNRERIAAEMLTMPIYDWDYLEQYKEEGDKRRFGCLANDFNDRITGNAEEMTIDVQRYCASLHLTVQELFYETKRLENLLWHVAEAQGIPLDARVFQGKKGKGKVMDIAEMIDGTPQHWTPITEFAGQQLEA